MSSLTTLTCFLCLLACSFLSVAQHLPVREAPKGYFSLQVYRASKNSHTRRGVTDYADPSATGDWTLWYINATAGGQPVDLLIDTGSADILITGNQNSDGSPYNPSLSKTAKQMAGASFDLDFEAPGFQATGDVWQDNFCIGDACIPDMAIDHSTNEGSGLREYRSGILGLAFQGANKITPNKQPTFMERLVPQLTAPIMSFKLGPPGTTSKLTFGGWDPEDIQGSIHQITINRGPTTRNPFFWVAQDVSVYVKGTRYAIGVSDMHFDTGSPFTTAPEAVVRAYYSKVPAAKDVFGNATYWSVPCNTPLPQLSLAFSPDPNTALPLNVGIMPNSTDSCSGMFSSSGTSGGTVGFEFFERYLVIFNQTRPEILVALQVGKG